MRLKKMTAVFLACAIVGTAALSGCGRINQNEAAVTLNDDTEISLGYANFVARYNQSYYDSFFSAYYAEGYWTSEDYVDDDGKTMEESTKDSVLKDIEIQYLLEAHMEDYGVEVTEEERTAITEAAEQFMADNSRDAVKEMGATQEYVEDMLYYYTVREKMRAAIQAEADTNVSDEEAAQRTFSYIKINRVTYTDDDGNTQVYSDDELTELKADAEAAAEEAKSDFDAAAENHSYTVQTYSYGSDEESEADGGFCDAVIEAANEMKEGDVSDLIEGSDYYYIVRLDSEYDEEATESKKESIISTRKSEHYTEVTDGYLEEADIQVNEKGWAKVKFDNVFTEVQETDDTSAAEE